MSATPALLQSHTALFNQGVRLGDFGPMAAQFAEGAELVFEGIPVGPFAGREAIARAYATQPPDDEIVILRAREEGATISAAYAWRGAPDQHAGDMILTLENGEIARLVVVYGAASPVSGRGDRPGS